MLKFLKPLLLNYAFPDPYRYAQITFMCRLRYSIDIGFGSFRHRFGFGGGFGKPARCCWTQRLTERHSIGAHGDLQAFTVKGPLDFVEYKWTRQATRK